MPSNQKPLVKSLVTRTESLLYFINVMYNVDAIPVSRIALVAWQLHPPIHSSTHPPIHSMSGVVHATPNLASKEFSALLAMLKLHQ